MTTHTRKSPRGISLLEVLVGLAVFATAFLLCLGVFPTAAQAVAQARAWSQATRLAEAELERVRAQPFEDIASGVTTASGAATVAGRSHAEAYTIQTTVTEPETGLKRIHVLVSWNGATTHYVRLETCHAKP